MFKCPWKDSDAAMILFKNVSAVNTALRLQHANEYKDQILSSVTHDLKTPLNCMIILINQLFRITDLSQIHDISKILLKTSHLLLSLIRDILDYS